MNAYMNRAAPFTAAAFAFVSALVCLFAQWWLAAVWATLTGFTFLLVAYMFGLSNEKDDLINELLEGKRHERG